MGTQSFTPKNERALDAFLDRDHPADSVACCDLDGTCLYPDVGEAVFYELARTNGLALEVLLASPVLWEPFDANPGLPDPRPVLRDFIGEKETQTERLAHALVRAYFGLERVETKLLAETWVALLLAGLTTDEVRTATRRVIEKQLARPLGHDTLSVNGAGPLEIEAGLVPYRPMADLIARLGDKGVECWIVSASNRWTVEVWAERFLNLPAERVIGMTPLTKDNLILARSDPDIPVTYGEGKVEAIDRIIGRRPVFAAGNSMNDWPMLQSATDLRLVVDSGDRVLAENLAGKKATQPEGWLFQPGFPTAG